MDFLKAFQGFFKLFFAFFSYIIRPIHKIIVRKLTKMCEIERACFRNNLEALKNSIMNSKQLPKLRQYVKNNMNNDKLDLNYLEELYQVKRVPKSEIRRNKILGNFLALNNIFLASYHLNERRKTAFDWNNNKHKKMLLELWEILMPKEKLNNLLTNQWIDIGFQADNPATDFRGGGVLALENLNFFCKYFEHNAKQCLETSHYIDSQYFFCSAGICITVQLISFLEKGKLDSLFSTQNPMNEKEIVGNFNEYYSKTFIEFNVYWSTHPQKSLMNFNSIINQFFEKKLQRLK